MREQECNTGLGLGIGGGEHCIPIRKLGDRDRKPPVQFHILFPTHMTEEEKEEQRPTKEHRRVPRPRNHNEEEDTTIGGMGDGASRKKLRLTREQSSLLENSFRNHNTLNTNQKQELAEKLNLTPRQVEVWFQNRRARSKVKQTEVDCEFLKKCCETLSNENRRLKMELQELQAVNASPAATPFFVPLQKVSTLTMCPSCKTIDAGDGSKDSNMAC